MNAAEHKQPVNNRVALLNTTKKRTTREKSKNNR